MTPPPFPLDEAEPLDTAVLSEELTRLIRTAPGIIAVYNTGSPVQTLLRTAADAARRESAREQLVHVTQEETGVTVSVVIGIDQTEPAATIGRRIRTLIREHLAQETDLLPVRVRVKIGRVD